MSADVLRRFRVVATDCGDVETYIAGVLRRARRLMCGVRGHEFLLHFGDRHMYLSCAACGHHTPGWHIGHPRVRRMRRAVHRIEEKRAA